MAAKRPDVSDLLDLAEQAEAALERLETRVGGQAARVVRQAAGPIVGEITRRWMLAFGALHPDTVDPGRLAELVAALRRVLRGFRADPSAPVRAALPDALALGVTNAGRVLGRRGVRPPAASRELRRAVAALADLVDEARAEATSRLRAVRDWDGVVHVIAAVSGAEHRADAAARWAVVRGVAEGTTHLADEAGVGRVWVAERTGACLECLAYQGRVARPGEQFPGGLTFRAGGKRRFPDPLPGPPRHPRCRCHVQPWLGVEAGQPSLLDALRREAQRAVLRGDAGDSGHARLQAADRLLARGTVLPVSVRERARRAIAAGEFPDRSTARPTRSA